MSQKTYAENYFAEKTHRQILQSVHFGHEHSFSMHQ